MSVRSWAFSSFYKELFPDDARREAETLSLRALGLVATAVAAAAAIGDLLPSVHKTGGFSFFATGWPGLIYSSLSLWLFSRRSALSKGAANLILLGFWVLLLPLTAFNGWRPWGFLPAFVAVGFLVLPWRRAIVLAVLGPLVLLATTSIGMDQLDWPRAIRSIRNVLLSSLPAAIVMYALQNPRIVWARDETLDSDGWLRRLDYLLVLFVYGALVSTQALLAAVNFNIYNALLAWPTIVVGIFAVVAFILVYWLTRDRALRPLARAFACVPVILALEIGSRQGVAFLTGWSGAALMLAYLLPLRVAGPAVLLALGCGFWMLQDNPDVGALDVSRGVAGALASVWIGALLRHHARTQSQSVFKGSADADSLVEHFDDERAFSRSPQAARALRLTWVAGVSVWMLSLIAVAVYVPVTEASRRSSLENKLNAYVVRLNAASSDLFHATDQLASLIKLHNGELPKVAEYMGMILRAFPLINTLDYAPGGANLHREPIAGNELVQGWDLLRGENVRAAAQQARDTGRSVLNGPFINARGLSVLTLRTPVLMPPEQTFWGLVQATIYADRLIEEAGLPAPGSPGDAYQIWSEGGSGQAIVHFPLADAGSAPPLRWREPAQEVSAPLAFPGLDGQIWRLSLRYKDGWVSLVEVLWLLHFTILAWLLVAGITKMLLRASARQDFDREHKRLSIEGRSAELEQAVTARTAELNLARLQLRTVLDAQDTLIAHWGADGKIRMTNRAYAQFLGRSPQDMIGRSVEELLPSQKSEPIRASFARVLQGEEIRCELRERDYNANIDRRMSVHLMPAITPTGEIDGVYSFINDVTSLVVAREEALAASQAKGQFLANMSHELRTPLNSIIGVQQLMMSSELTAQQRKYMTAAAESADTLLRLMNDILDLSKIDSGRLEIERAPFSVERLMQSLAAMMSTPEAVTRDLDLLLDLDPTLPDVLVGDALRLQQVLMNLTSNAMKFTLKGSVTLRVKVAQRDARSMQVLFEVQDTGVGIAPRNQAKIFDVFTQAESSTTRRFGGSGLGLPISRRLVNAMGGTLTLSSQLDVGTTLSFSIPLGWEPEESSTNAALACAPGAGADSGAGRMLLVVPSVASQRILKAMAQQLNWQVTAVDAYPLALNQMGQASQAGADFDVVLLDWGLASKVSFDDFQMLTAPRASQGGDTHAPKLLLYGFETDFEAQKNYLIRNRYKSIASGFLNRPCTRWLLKEVLDEMMAGVDSAKPKRGDATVSPKPTPAVDTPPLQGMRVLVVEDMMVNRMVAKHMLVLEGAIVSTANDGREGVQAVEDALRNGAPFDVVLMDMQMPVLDGVGATREIRDRLRLDDEVLPVIALTANAMSQDIEKCIAAGMNGHISKPININELVDKILLHARPSACSDNVSPLLWGRPT